MLLLFSSQSCLTFCDLMDCTTPGLSISISQSLPKFMYIALVVPSSHLIFWHPLLLPSIFPSIRVFSNELVVFIRWPKYWSFSVRTSNKCSGLIPLKIDWFDLAAQGIFRSLLQHHSLKASILQHPAFFIIQLSQVRDHWRDHSLDYMDLCWQSNISLLLNTLSRFVIAFLSRSKCLLISWLQSASAVILEPKKRKSVTTANFPPCICHAKMGPDAMILIFLMFSFKLALSLSSFTLIKRLFNSSYLSAIRVVSSAYLRLLIFLPPMLIPACNSSSLAFLMMCSAHKLNKQGDSTLSYSFLNLEPVSCSIRGSICCFMTHILVSQETGKMVWYSHLFQSFPWFIMTHAVEGFGIVDETVDVFSEIP